MYSLSGTLALVAISASGALAAMADPFMNFGTPFQMQVSDEQQQSGGPKVYLDTPSSGSSGRHLAIGGTFGQTFVLDDTGLSATQVTGSVDSGTLYAVVEDGVIVFKDTSNADNLFNVASARANNTGLLMYKNSFDLYACTGVSGVSEGTQVVCTEDTAGDNCTEVRVLTLSYTDLAVAWTSRLGQDPTTAASASSGAASSTSSSADNADVGAAVALAAGSTGTLVALALALII